MHTDASRNRLKELRQARGLRIVHVAAHINKDQTTVHRYETGQNPIPDDVKAQLASFFGVSRAYLMGWDEDCDKPLEVVA
jgi:transcriptional regulator with XRE-family HTH domain